MSRCRFIHDFWSDGRSDVLARVRILRARSQWTKKRRAAWLRDAVSTYAHFKHRFPRMNVSYYAGRVAALKSQKSAHFETPPSEQRSVALIYRPLPPDRTRRCSFSDCGGKALWGLCLQGDIRPLVLLCDPCRQEWQRSEMAYVTPDGWDWDDDEELPRLPRLYSRETALALMQEDAVELGKTVLPLTTIMSFDLVS